MKHIMIDLETWGTRPGCALRSIGACTFYTLADLLVPEAFYVNIEKESQLALGLHIDPRTEAWWAKQSDMAKAQPESDPQSLKIAVIAFDSWFKSQNPDFIWSHGAAFDIPVYDAAIFELGIQVPWDYRKVRDTRTLFGLTNFNPRDVPFEGTKHNALSDAIHQAKCVQLALNMYRRGK